MKISGEATLVAPVASVWDALLDPQVLVATIPGCERLEQTGEHAYAMTVTAGVAAVRGTYDGTCSLHDLAEHQSLRMRLQGSGAPGTIDAGVDVRFDDNGDSTTTLTYDADAVVGGTIGGVGQRMLSSVSRRMATEFFTNVERVIAQGVPGVAEAPAAGAPEQAVTPGVPAAGGTAAAEAAPGQAVAGEAAPAGAPGAGAVYTAPRASQGQCQGISSDFWLGLATGAGLVLAGTVVGGLLGRRR